MNRSLNVLYQNVRGLRTKANEFFCNVSSSIFSVVVLTETWLLPSISSKDYFPPYYNVFRSDRATRTGGGALIAVNSSFRCVRRADLETEDESVWVDLCCIGGERVLLGAFYLAPNIAPVSFQTCLASIENVISSHPRHRIMILGDFNSPGIEWGDLSISHYNTYVLQKASALLDFISFTGLEQCNHVVNSAGSLLDLCFSNIENISVNISPTGLVTPDNYHPPLSIVLPIHSDVQKAKPLVSELPNSPAIILLQVTTLVFTSTCRILIGRQSSRQMTQIFRPAN